MRNSKFCLSVCLGFTVGGPSFAHSIKQKAAGYEDTDGHTRQRVAYDMTIDGGAAKSVPLTDSTYSLQIQSDQFQNSEVTNDNYDREVYDGSDFRQTQRATLATTHTWDRLTETRLLAAYATDQKVKSKTWAVGMSQWIWSETIRLAVDLSRTILEQPLYQVLDFDSQEIGNPTIASSTGSTVGVRHLAGPTTILDYTVGYTMTENRPDTKTGTVAIRQFLPPLDGAIHASATRADNRGYVTTESNYGQVDAWFGELAYLQNLWKGGHLRSGFRYYKEDEITRAYEDEKVFGSDTGSLGLSQDLPKGAIDNVAVPLTLEASAARYLTNVGIAATSFEAGVTAKF